MRSAQAKHPIVHKRTPRRLISCVVLGVTTSLLASCGVPQADYDKLAERVVALEKQAKAPRVERLVIVDKDGKERGMFGLREKDSTPALRLKDEKGTNRVLLRLHPTGMPIFVMCGEGGKGTSYLSVPGAGPPSLLFFSDKGEQVFKAPAPPVTRRR